MKFRIRHDNVEATVTARLFGVFATVSLNIDGTAVKLTNGTVADVIATTHTVLETWSTSRGGLSRDTIGAVRGDLAEISRRFRY